ncbi:unnamed protein product, partial [Protopolystoma xenopodis]
MFHLDSILDRGKSTHKSTPSELDELELIEDHLKSQPELLAVDLNPDPESLPSEVELPACPDLSITNRPVEHSDSTRLGQFDASSDVKLNPSASQDIDSETDERNRLPDLALPIAEEDAEDEDEEDDDDEDEDNNATG